MPGNGDGAFGDVLREHRVRVGLSQEQLAEMAGVSTAAIGALERGTRRSPQNETIARLIRALRLGPEEQAEFKAQAQARRARSRAPVSRAAKHLHHIPTPSTSMLGRAADLERTIALLATYRVVTLTGSGGIGKTRLALEVARRVCDRTWEQVCFADFTPLTDGLFIAGQIASAIEPPLAGHVESVSDLVARIGDRRMLLVLDNCEHLVDELASTANAIIAGCPNVTILATSRERLNINGESIHRLPPLALPDAAPRTLDGATEHAALNLFLERSLQRDPSVTFTNDSISFLYGICRRLDGIPLAIELAAARLPFLGLKMLDALLDDYFSLPGIPRNLPPRQQTMDATIAWSFALLGPSERDLLARLAIFRGGFTLQAAQSVCAFGTVDGTSIVRLLASLAEKSLINIVHKNDSVRYVLLDSTRSFASDQLDSSGQRTVTARRHAQWLAEIGDRVPLQALSAEAFSELVPELDNARAALSWTLESPLEDDHALSGRIITGLKDLWILSGRRSELRRFSVAALKLIDESKSPDVAAKLLQMYIVLAFNEPDVVGAIQRAIPLFDRIGDARSIVKLHSSLTFIFAYRGLIPDAERSAGRVEALYSTAKSKRSQEYVEFLYSRAMLREAQQRFDDARADIERGEEIATSMGYTLFVTRKLKKRRIFIEASAGNPRRAMEIAREMLASDFGNNPEVISDANQCLAVLHLLLGEADEAAAAATVVLDATRVDESLVVQYVAGIAALRGEPRRAARLMGFVDALLKRVPSQRDALQQQSWERLCSSVATQLEPGALALLRAEGAMLNARSAQDEARAVLSPS